jgi:glutaredoxin-related protein
MKLKLFYYNECGFSASVLNTIRNLKVEDKVELMNIRENPEFEKQLVIECGDNQVPTLFVDGNPMRESEEIKKFLVQSFM